MRVWNSVGVEMRAGQEWAGESQGWWVWVGARRSLPTPGAFEVASIHCGSWYMGGSRLKEGPKPSVNVRAQRTETSLTSLSTTLGLARHLTCHRLAPLSAELNGPLSLSPSMGYCNRQDSCHWFYISFRNFLVNFFGSTGLWTQDCMLTRQTIYHWNHAYGSFCSGYFGGRILLFPQTSLDTSLLFYTSHSSWGDHAQIFCWDFFSTEMGSQELRPSSLTWNCSSPFSSQPPA
jgi:hypothetical protein